MVELGDVNKGIALHCDPLLAEHLASATTSLPSPYHVFTHGVPSPITPPEWTNLSPPAQRFRVVCSALILKHTLP
jgi:hypothetical protein